MDRRDSIKSIMLGSIGVGVLFESCVNGVSNEEIKKTISKFQYGRTEKEKAYDKKLFSIVFNSLSLKNVEFKNSTSLFFSSAVLPY